MENVLDRYNMQDIPYVMPKIIIAVPPTNLIIPDLVDKGQYRGVRE